VSVRSSLRERLAGALTRAETGARHAGPAMQLARIDTGALRAWMRWRGAVVEALGEEAGESYTGLVLQASATDGDLARIVAVALPEPMARVPAAHRSGYARLLREVLRVRPHAAPLLARVLPELMGTMDDVALRAFVARGLALHAESPQRAESFLRRESGESHAAVRELVRGVTLADVSRTLTLYARAHCGEDVQVRPGKGNAFSDGHHVYLPEVVDTFGDARDFQVYRVLTALAAGYLEFGTFDLRLDRVAGAWPDARDGEGEVERYFRAFSNRSLARDLFQILEDARVERRIRVAYPGIARDLDALGPALRGDRPDPKEPTLRVIEAVARRAWGLPELALAPDEADAAAPFLAALAQVDELDVNGIAGVVHAHYGSVERLMRKAEEGTRPNPNGTRHVRPPNEAAPEPEAFRPSPLAPRIRPEEAGAEERRVEEEAQRLLREMEAADGDGPQSPTEARRAAREAKSRGEDRSYADMEAFLERNPAKGGAKVDERAAPEREAKAATGLSLDPDVEPGGRVFTYREWDTTIEDYKPRWVVVREQRLKEGDRAFVDDVLRREKVLIDALRRRFEALRPQGMVRARNLTDGDELDIDRVVEDAVGRRAGQPRNDRVYTRDERARRDVAVAFLVDMSSSTNESADGTGRRIIDVEKTALIVVAEALNALGDPFAVWGFSGYGRDHVAFYVAKEFGDAWDDRARQRVGRIGFKMENRDGAAIRHATARLMKQPARARLLILLSDGKPLDCGCDHYFDRYAQDDTRAALREARAQGVHPFCITVDPNGAKYLPRMYGDVAYTVIDRVELLPSRIVQVYRRLAL
jgi:nitric oxide reductase NorD protein